jgi:hypothetical protein
MAGDYELHAFLETPGAARTPFFLRISKPRKDRSKIDYYCRVHLPLLLRGDKDIYGISPNQARTLAKDFLKILFSGKKITDANGDPISL